MNTPFLTQHIQDALDDQASGGMQRISAFLLKRKNVNHAKRTLIVGSAGEMASRHTIPSPARGIVKTDLLIQAVMADDVDSTVFLDLPLKGIMDESRKYTFRHIEIKDFLVYCHFEEFVSTCANRPVFKRNYMAAMKDNINGLKSLIKNDKKVRPVNRSLLTENRVFVLKRRGPQFEAAMPHDARELRT